MRKNYITYIVFLLISSNVYCIFEEREIFADASSICGAVYSKESVCSLYYNPACIFSSYKYNFYFSNTRLFDIEELINNSLCLVLDFDKIGNFGLLYNIFGFELYKENNIHFTYAKKFNRFNVGISLKLLYLNIKQYGEENYLSFDFGFLGVVSKNLSSGFVIKNFLNNYSNLEKSLIITNKIKIFENIFTYIDILKSQTNSLYGRLGYEGTIKLKNFEFNLRFGVETSNQTKPAKYSFGIGIYYDINKFFSLSFDYGCLVHNILGSQNLYSLCGYLIKKEKKPPLDEINKSTATLENKNLKRSNKTSLPQQPIDLNTATEKELMQLPTVGKKFAQKIVEYRIKVGSFTSVEQLLNIPRFGTKRLEKIKPYLTITQQIFEFEVERTTQSFIFQQEILKKETYNINTATLKEFLEIGFDILSAKNVIRYRKKFGKINSFEELYKIPNINLETLEKLKEKIVFE